MHQAHFLPSLFTAFGNRIARAEQGQERLVPSLENGPGALIGLSGGVIGGDRHQAGEGACSDFVAPCRKGRVVGRHSRIVQALGATRFHNAPNREPRAVARKGAPYVKGLGNETGACGQAAVAHCDARKMRGHFSGHAQAHQ